MYVLCIHVVTLEEFRYDKGLRKWDVRILKDSINHYFSSHQVKLGRGHGLRLPFTKRSTFQVEDRF